MGHTCIRRAKQLNVPREKNGIFLCLLVVPPGTSRPLDRKLQLIITISFKGCIRECERAVIFPLKSRSILSRSSPPERKCPLQKRMLLKIIPDPSGIRLPFPNNPCMAYLPTNLYYIQHKKSSIHVGKYTYTTWVFP